MKKLRSDDLKTLHMYPNGKQPLSSTGRWKPSDGYTDKSSSFKVLVQRGAMVAVLLAIAAGLVVVSTITK